MSGRYTTIAAGVATLALSSAETRAQGTPVITNGGSAMRPDSATSIAFVAARGADGGAEIRVGAAVSLAATPNSFTVISIPVPASIPASRSVTYTVMPAAAGTVLGRLEGVLAPTNGPRAILITLGVPARIRAGDAALARVRFAAGDEVVDVPILVAIAAVQRIQLMAVEGLGAVKAGSTFALGYRLTNLGNAPDTVDMQVVLPAGWRLTDAVTRPRIALPMNTTIERTVQAYVPPGAAGLSQVRFIAMSHGAAIATAEVMVEVLSPQTIAAAGGPMLTLGSGVAGGPWGSPASMYTAQLDGLVSDGINVSARASAAPWHNGGAVYSFARANLYAAPPSVTLSSREWRLGLGIAGTSISDLAGVNLSGSGLSAELHQTSWNASAILARPGSGFERLRGSMAGARIEHLDDWGSLSASAAHYDETRQETRRLDAFAIGGGLTDLIGGSLTGEIAERRFEQGRGMGWTTSWQRHTDRDNIDVRLTHAPGGTRAFARASDEFMAMASRRISPRLSVNGSAWRSSDDGSVTFQKLDMSGSMAGGRFTVSRALGLSVNGRRSTFGALSASGGFGDAESSAEVTVDARAGGFALTGSAGRATVERKTVFDADQLVRRAPRATFRGSLTTGGSLGTVALTGRYEENGPGIGFAARQWEYGFHVDKVPLVANDVARVYASAGIQRLGGVAVGLDGLSANAAVALETNYGAGLTLSAERNPFMWAGARRSGWMYVMSVTKSVRLPRVSRSRSLGIVFKDLNGNGIRDGDEPGFAGIVVRRGYDVAVSDAQGRYGFLSETNQALELDSRSLPLGWLAPSTSIPAGVRSIGIVAVSSVEVRLVLRDADTARVSAADLEAIAVVARDSLGHEWLARRSSATQAIFDALPPGSYSLDVDASEAKEPLHVDGALPVLRVGAGAPNAPTVILLRPRALRFNMPSRFFRRVDDPGRRQGPGDTR